jgi:hypothetical protein
MIHIIQTNKHDNFTSPLGRNEEFASQFNINPFKIQANSLMKITNNIGQYVIGVINCNIKLLTMT